ncbi:MAG TPA: hypothetical protein PKD61_28065, partial [Polyangiaceae bacterium]|nr:hypothetical protein [Polyangiaceae bacterium]
TGRGADVMRPMALPLIGGMSIELLTLFVVPVLYSLGEELRLERRLRKEALGMPVTAAEAST